jgi:hypothetical protein
MIRITPDYETAERCGASGTFQVISVIEEDESGKEKDITAKIDQGQHYHSAEDVIRDLGFDPEKVEFKLE